MDKEDGYIYTMEHYSTMKKNEIMSFAAAGMDLEIMVLSEPDKDKYHDITYVGRQNNVTNELTWKSVTNELTWKTDTELQT